jgi:hypothetical protein
MAPGRKTGGRPEGTPKTGGRKKGTPNKATAEVKARAAVYAVEAVDALGSIMRNPKSPPQAQVAAAWELLGRAHGEPTQALDLSPHDVPDARQEPGG